MENYLTPEGFEKLKKELEYLKTVKRKEIAKRLKKAISFGDLSENAAYEEAKNAQAFLEGKILELEKIINGAKVLKNIKKDCVGIGSKVSVKSEKDEEEMNFQIVGENESNSFEGKISHESPLGIALFGKKEGDVVEVKTPEGDEKYEILEIG
jgi:transcription elongation factor GreA